MLNPSLTVNGFNPLVLSLLCNPRGTEFIEALSHARHCRNWPILRQQHRTKYYYYYETTATFCAS